MDKSRRLVLLSASAAVVLAGCGGGDDDPAPAPPASTPPPAPPGPAPVALSCGATGTAIAGNHGHTLTIPQADLDSTTNMTYDIRGQSNHPHSVTLTPAQLAQIKAGTEVTVVSSEDSSHTHAVTCNCAPA